MIECIFIESGIIILIGGFVLFIVGFGAAWEVRAIGSLSDQIKRLKQLREKLQAQTSTSLLSPHLSACVSSWVALQGQVVGMKEENEELEENVEVTQS